MPTPPPWEEIIAAEDRYLTPEPVEQEYAPRSPMVLLKRKYLPSKFRPDPPLVHFAFPIHDLKWIYDYAIKHDLVEYYPNTIFKPPPVATEFTWWKVVQRLSQQLLDEDEDDVIALLQEELGVGPDVRPKWYFDESDPFDPKEEGESDGSDTPTERGSDGNGAKNATSMSANEQPKSTPLASQIAP
ncbi:hypothetical protein DENSPDRAFT_79412 [Dentipellis sp. KUC8613]|nr:hypothetical protein DENSPDRAFT_79412 [Dentipellis sp. KUC8613]